MGCAEWPGLGHMLTPWKTRGALTRGRGVVSGEAGTIQGSLPGRWAQTIDIICEKVINTLKETGKGVSVSEWGQGGLTGKVTFQQSPGGKGTRSVPRRGNKGRGQGAQPERVTAGVGGCQQGPVGLGRVWLQLGGLNSVRGLGPGHHHCLGGLWTDAAAASGPLDRCSCFSSPQQPSALLWSGGFSPCPRAFSAFSLEASPRKPALPPTCLAATLAPPSLG